MLCASGSAAKIHKAVDSNFAALQIDILLGTDDFNTVKSGTARHRLGHSGSVQVKVVSVRLNPLKINFLLSQFCSVQVSPFLLTPNLDKVGSACLGRVSFGLFQFLFGWFKALQTCSTQFGSLYCNYRENCETKTALGKQRLPTTISLEDLMNSMI